MTTNSIEKLIQITTMECMYGILQKMKNEKELEINLENKENNLTQLITMIKSIEKLMKINQRTKYYYFFTWDYKVSSSKCHK